MCHPAGQIPRFVLRRVRRRDRDPLILPMNTSQPSFLSFPLKVNHLKDQNSAPADWQYCTRYGPTKPVCLLGPAIGTVRLPSRPTGDGSRRYCSHSKLTFSSLSCSASARNRGVPSSIGVVRGIHLTMFRHLIFIARLRFFTPKRLSEGNVPPNPCILTIK